MDEFPDEVEVTELSGPLPAEIQTTAVGFPVRARQIVIKDQESLVVANDWRNQIRALKVQVDEAFDPIIDAAHVAHMKSIEQKKKFWGPLDQAYRIIKQKISEYQAELERQRLEAARAKERAEAEARRIADEAADKAHELIGKGDIDKAEKVIDTATAKVETILDKAPVIPEAVKLNGFKERTQWYAEVTDLGALIAAVAAGKVNQAVLEANMPVLNKMASALKDQMNIAGVVARSRKV